MTVQTLEKKIKAFGAPVRSPLLKWLYLHLPPQPLTSRKMHQAYAQAVRLLMKEKLNGTLDAASQEAVTQYLNSAMPFIEDYEKKEFQIGSAAPEEVLRFLMDQNGLSQRDLAAELGGQPAVSYVLSGRRKLTREQIARLSRRFRISEASFYPSALGAIAGLWKGRKDVPDTQAYVRELRKGTRLSRLSRRTDA